MEGGVSSERERIQSLAEGYRLQGYEVIEEPSQEQLPEFLAGFRPDMVVHKEDESVVIEVKRHASLHKNSEVAELARKLRSQPGWSFKLVFTEPGERLTISEAAIPFDRENILYCIKEAENLLAEGYAEAAMTRALAAADGTVRLMTMEEGFHTDLYTSPYLLSLATWEGIISADDYRFLRETMRIRDTYINGFTLPNFDPGQVKDIIVTAKRLFEEATNPASG